jgi:hypothetical protein
LLTIATQAAISHEGPHGLVPFDKNTALNMAMKHLGLFERDNAQQALRKIRRQRTPFPLIRPQVF